MKGIKYALLALYMAVWTSSWWACAFWGDPQSPDLAGLHFLWPASGLMTLIACIVAGQWLNVHWEDDDNESE